MKQVSLCAVNRPSPPIADTRLSGMRLIIARSIWIVLMLIFCGLYLAAVLVYYVQLHGFQEGVYAYLISTPAVVSGYDAFEFSSALLTGPYATLNFTLVTLVLPPFWIAVSLVIFWCRSDDWMALIVALFLVMLVTIFSPALSALSSVIGYTSPLGMCITLLQLLAMSSFGFFIALFPDGRFVLHYEPAKAPPSHGNFGSPRTFCRWYCEEPRKPCLQPSYQTSHLSIASLVVVCQSITQA